MKTAVTISGAVTMQLSEALLIYRDQQGGSYVTRHQVVNGAMGPAQLLTSEFLLQLSEELNKSMELEILPPNVLARTQDTIVWWTPATRRRMFFTADSTKDQAHKLSGKPFPQPPLVWMVRDNDLYVRAMENSERPKADTPLFVSPYWNVSESGLVCTGNMTTPDTRSAEGITIWVDGFFSSNFSHPNNPKVTSFPGGYIALALAISEHDQQFPTKYLINAKQTLGQFIKEQRG